MAIYFDSDFKTSLERVIIWLEAVNSERTNRCEGLYLRIQLEKMFYNFSRSMRVRRKTEGSSAVQIIEELGDTFLLQVGRDQFPHHVFKQTGGERDAVMRASGLTVGGAPHPVIQAGAGNASTLPLFPNGQHSSTIGTKSVSLPSNSMLAITNSSAPATQNYVPSSNQLVTTNHGVITNGIICVFLLAEKLQVAKKDGNVIRCRFMNCSNPHVELKDISGEEAERAVRISTSPGSPLQEDLITAISGNPSFFK
jgi:hypothetical protein